MKFLAVPELAALSGCLTARVVGDIVVDGKADLFSCKQHRRGQ
jgi:hypothetical protein